LILTCLRDLRDLCITKQVSKSGFGLADRKIQPRMRNGALKSFAQDNRIAARHTNSIMAHTPLVKLLRHAASTAAQSDGRDAPVDDFAMSRREFVRTISAATAGLALPASLFATKQIATSARVVVVGAGLAGLTCACRLKQSGIIATVYEANTRLGGRCWTRRGDFDQGQIAEHGGELIDQGHTAISPSRTGASSAAG
jgi:hypothetical protein